MISLIPKPYHIIADSAFPSKEWLITPFKKSSGQPLSQAKKIFNRKLSSTRMVIELIFGDLKNRFKRCRGDRGYVGHGAIMYRAIKICKSL